MGLPSFLFGVEVTFRDFPTSEANPLSRAPNCALKSLGSEACSKPMVWVAAAQCTAQRNIKFEHIEFGLCLPAAWCPLARTLLGKHIRFAHV